MGQKPDAKLTPEVARELCQRTGGTAVLDGSIGQIGAQYLLTLKAVNCASGESLASTEARASDKNHVLDALGKTAVEMRSKLGESLSTVQKFDTPLEQATTTSLEALKAYSSARREMSPLAIPLFKRAVELDPNFAVAYAEASQSRVREAAMRDAASLWKRIVVGIPIIKSVSFRIEVVEVPCPSVIRHGAQKNQRRLHSRNRSENTSPIGVGL